MKNNILFKFSISQKNRIKKNFSALFINLSSKLFIQIIYPPLMLLFWGIENFGIWIFVTAIPATITMFNLNFSYAARIEMSIYDSKNKKNLVNKIFHNAFGLIIMNMTIFTIVWVSALFLTDLNLKIFEKIEANDLKLILFLIILSFYFTIFQSILITGITYWGKLNVATNIKTIFEFLSKIFIILAGLFFDNLIYAAIIFLVASVLQTFFLYYHYTINKKYLFLSTKLLNLKDSLSLFRLSLSYYSETLTTLIKQNGLIILLGIFFTAEVVGMVSTAKTLFYFLPLKFINLIVHTSIYEYSLAYAKKNIQQLKYNFKRQIFYTLVLLSMFIFLSLIIGPKIYNFWTHNKYELNYFLILLIVFDSFFYNLRDTVSIILKSVNKFFKPALIETIFSILSLLISYYYLTLGHNLKSILSIYLIATFVSLINYTYFSLKFYYKLK